MKTALRVLACAVIAVLAWFGAYWVAIQIPGSPFHRMSASDLMARLDDPTTGPAAFEEFLALGERMRWVEAVFSVVAAVVVVAGSYLVFHLSLAESAAVAMLFSIFLFAFGAGINWPRVVAIFIFSAIVVFGASRSRQARSPTRRSSRRGLAAELP